MQEIPKPPPESTSTASTPPPPPINKITRGHSCILCQQRKVRCDRQKPCANCIKARTECVPSAPSVPRRKRRKLTETDLVGRLRKYEHLLRKNGVKIDDDEEVPEPPPANPQPPQQQQQLPHEFFGRHGGRGGMHGHGHRGRGRPPPGALFADRDNSRMVENTMWDNLRDELTDPRDALQTSSDDDATTENGFSPNPENLLVGYPPTPHNLRSLHPQPVQIFRLWQTFLVNVNPLVKMFHSPTVQQIILDASGDLDHVPRHIEVLMFAVYFLAVTSLRNEECESMLGEPRTALLARYLNATQQGLINARFLKSLNIFTLQSLVLFLLGVRKFYDPQTQWVLSGSTVRIAQRLGLHRDGANHRISPFDAEIRRRTWWQIVFLDGNSSKLAGTGFPSWLAKFDTKIPLNISDSDLSPTMKEPPVEKEGATEMIFCCLRYETAQALRGTKHFKQREDGAWGFATGAAALAEKDKAIDEVEARFQTRFVRFCDPSIPLHLLVIYVAQSVICTMRIMAHHPRQYPDKGASMPQKEKDMVFTESLKELEFDSLGYTTKAIQGYLWHVTGHFQLDAFIYLLSELRHRTKGDLVDRAWYQIQLAFEHRPEIIEDTRNSLYLAMGNLALKAWANREEAIGVSQVPPPRFVSLLRAKRNISDVSRNAPPVRKDSYQQRNKTVPSTESQNPWQQPQQMDLGSGYLGGGSGAQQLWREEGTYDAHNMPEITPVDWEYWQTLMDGDLPAFNGAAPMGGDIPGPNQPWFQ